MVLIKTDRIKKYLTTINRNQEWLARQYNVRPSYISQIIHNRCHISGNFIGFILSLSHMSFDDLFYYDRNEDSRKFYGRQIFWNKRSMDLRTYNRLVKCYKKTQELPVALENSGESSA